MIVAAIGALTLKSSPNATIGVTQTTISSGVAGAAPAPQGSTSKANARTASANSSASDTVTTTTVKASAGVLSTIPAGAVIVPAPTGNEGSEGNEGNEHSVTSTTIVKNVTPTTVRSGTTSGGHEGSGERE